jgi:hypothetical protein
MERCIRCIELEIDLYKAELHVKFNREIVMWILDHLKPEDKAAMQKDLTAEVNRRIKLRQESEAEFVASFKKV